MRQKVILLFVIILASGNSFSQKSVYSDKCELTRNLLDTADQAFFNFINIAKDSVIIIMDIDEVLLECTINVGNSTKINIVRSGSEYEKIKNKGFLAHRNTSKIF